MSGHVYIIIDLKSFYASCECAERGLDPMTTDLVVADPERGRGTICLAVSPSLKAKGVKNRCRVFEIPSFLHPIVAEPRMQLYINYAAEIYGIYLSYFDKNDIYVYSVDEAFIDVSPYLLTYKKTPRELGKTLLGEIARRLGLPATLGIGTNLYLAKIALDITAKQAPDRIGELNEEKYCRELWATGPSRIFGASGAASNAVLRTSAFSPWAALHTARKNVSAKPSASTGPFFTTTPGAANRQPLRTSKPIIRENTPSPTARS